MARESEVARQSSFRVWQLDLARGLAVIGMIIYHLLFTLVFIYGWEINLLTGPWKLVQRLVAGTFLFLVGVSLTLSYDKARSLGWKQERIFVKFATRAAKVLLFASLVSVLSLLWVSSYYVRFGVLHLIGLASILSYPWLLRRNWAVGTALIVLLLGWTRPFWGWIPPTEAWLWLGFAPKGFHTLDWFPLFPWWGVILAGIGFSNPLLTRLPAREHPGWLRPLLWIGRHALLIYLLHQPVLLLLLWIIFR